MVSRAFSTPSVPSSPPRSHADLPVNPFSRAALAANKTQSVEGGILMLHDLQESEASRAALVSAWRDYGSQVRAPARLVRPRARASAARCVAPASPPMICREAGATPPRLRARLRLRIDQCSRPWLAPLP